MLELRIHEQNIETVNSTDYTRGTVGAKVKITFDDFWADYEKTVVFKRCYDALSKPIKILVNTMSVTLDIPPEILAESGKYKIGAIGIRNGVVLPTLYSEEFNSLYATDTKGFKNADKYTPSELEQLRLLKQDKLVAGDNVTIDKNNVISFEKTQPDWNQNNPTKPDYINNKPSIQSGKGENSIVSGTGTTATNDNQVSFGSYNENKDGALFEIGNGKGEQWIEVHSYQGYGRYKITTYDGYIRHDGNVQNEEDFDFLYSYYGSECLFHYLQNGSNNAFAVLEDGSIEINGTKLTDDQIANMVAKDYVDDKLTLTFNSDNDLPTPILLLEGNEGVTITWDGTVATSFSSTAAGTKDDPIIISTASELNYLVNKATNTTGKYYKIADGIGAIVLQSSDKSKDITSLSNETAVKIYFESNNCTTWRGNTSPNTFDGHFDGNGATIYGLYIKETSYSGLFGTLGGNSTVKNLTVKNSYFKTGWYAGVIAGNIADSGGGTVSIEKCVITNCCVVGKYIVETDTGVKNIPNQCIGLMFGRPNNVDNTTISISNCLVCGNNVHYEYDGSINNYLIGLSKDTKIKNSVMLNFADLVFNGISAETLNIYTDQEITNIEDIKGEKAIAAMPNLAWGVDWFAATTYNAKPVPLDFLQLGTTALLAMINDNQDALNGKKITSLHTSGKYTFDWNAMYFIKSNSGNADINLYNSVTNAVLVDGDGNNLPAASLCILIMPEESTGVAENSKLCFFVGQTGTFSILNPNVFKGLQFTVNNGDVYFTPTTSASVFKIAL